MQLYRLNVLVVVVLHLNPVQEQVFIVQSALVNYKLPFLFVAKIGI